MCWTRSIPALQRVSVCTLVYIFSVPAGNLQLFLSIYFFLTQDLKVSQKWEFGLLNSFLSCIWTAPHTIVISILMNMLVLLNTILTSHSLAFPCKFLAKFLFSPNCFHCFSQLWCSTIATDCFWQVTQGKSCSQWASSDLCHKKTNPEWRFLENFQIE